MPPKQRQPPLDVLQAMINLILIETGRALRSADKNGGSSFTIAGARLRKTVPGAVDNFHQALDDLEYDIVRAKAVLHRDLGELQSNRLPKPDPVKVEPEVVVDPAQSEPPEVNQPLDDSISEAPVEAQVTTETEPVKQEASEDADGGINDVKSATSSQPQSANPINDTPFKEGIGLGIKTDGISEGVFAVGTEEGDVSAVDSLFGPPDDTPIDTNQNLDDMELPVTATTTNPSQPHTQIDEFDLSTFGNNTQDFSMPDIQTTTDITPIDNAGLEASNKQFDNLFDIEPTSADGDNMDLDMNLDESTFADMFFDDADDTTLGDGGEMQHGEFDNAFFGL